jgi:RHS repeat-associated protein
VGTTNMASYSYKLNPAGRRTNAVEVLRQEDNTYLTNTLSWQFDGMYRLTNEVSVCSAGAYTYTNAYQYDKVGNRLKKTRTGNAPETISYSYNANDQLTNQVSSLGTTTTYGYDPNGSLTNETVGSTVNSYTYNVANKLTAVAVNGTIAASYLYNDEGIRVQTTAGATTHYLIDANNHTGYAQVLEELPTVGGTPNMSYVIGNDVLAQCGPTVTTPSYFLQDGHGSNRQLTQLNATVTSHYSYEAYGAVQGSSSTTANAAPTTKLYCGEQYDSNLQMYNLRTRYYDPSNGRFNQRDTFAGNNEDPQTLHRYLYANCDPVNVIDPLGQQGDMISLMCSCAICATVAAAVCGAVGYAYGGVKGEIAGIIFGIGLGVALATDTVMVGFWGGFIDAMLALVIDFETNYYFPGTVSSKELAEDAIYTFEYGFTAAIYNEFIAENSPVLESVVGAIASVVKDLADWYSVYLDPSKSQTDKDEANVTLVTALVTDLTGSFLQACFIKSLSKDKKYIYITGAPAWLMDALDKKLWRLSAEWWDNIQKFIRKEIDALMLTIQGSVKVVQKDT